MLAKPKFFQISRRLKKYHKIPQNCSCRSEDYVNPSAAVVFNYDAIHEDVMAVQTETCGLN